MRIHNLGSGSGGNATLVAHDGRAILIDAGLPLRRMREAVDGLDLLGVLITHRHRDHLGPYAERLGARVFIERANEIDARDHGWLSGPVENFATEEFRLGPFRIEPFELPHPGGAWSSFGFRIECGRRRFAYATDLGSVPDPALEAVRDSHAVFLESNHDPELEETSGRPVHLIRWVMSPFGHLSNDKCAGALSHAKRAHTMMLGHLSHDCNRPALALKTARKALRRGVRLCAAKQDLPGPVVQA